MSWTDRVEEAHARIRGTVRETPAVEAPELAPGFTGRLVFKLEHLQRTGSFKIRGAANRIARLTPTEAAAGVVTSSTGNHGLGVAVAAREAGVRAEVRVSTHVGPERLRALREAGAEVVVDGADALEAELAARAAAEAAGAVYVSPYNDPDVVAGQGTIAPELARQVPDLDAVFVAVGGGGLVGGIGAWLAERMPRVEVVGCWPENAPALHECIRRGRVVEVAERPTLSESTAGGIEPGSLTLDLAARVIRRHVLVSEGEILEAMRRLRDARGWEVEGAAGVAFAAFLRAREEMEGRTVAVVLCGGNLSPRVRDALEGAAAGL